MFSVTLRVSPLGEKEDHGFRGFRGWGVCGLGVGHLGNLGFQGFGSEEVS